MWVVICLNMRLLSIISGIETRPMDTCNVRESTYACKLPYMETLLTVFPPGKWYDAVLGGNRFVLQLTHVSLAR